MRASPIRRLLPALLALALGALACKKAPPPTGSAPPSASASLSAASSASAAKQEVPLEYKEITQLGVQIRVPATATIEDSPGDGDVMVMSSDPECTVMVSLVDDVSDDYAATFDGINKGLAGGTLKELTKQEHAGDTWDLEYTATSDVDHALKYGINVRVKIDGKLYDCTRVTDAQDAATCVAKACASLKKA